MENRLVVAAVAALVIIVAGAAYYSGAFSNNARADLSLGVEVVPAAQYSGEAAEFRVTVTNAGGAAADSAILQLSVDGVPAAQKSFSVPAGGSAYIPIKWRAESPGIHSFRVIADAGNAIQESNESNNEYSSSLAVLPSVEEDVFSGIPDQNITRAYYANATQAGLNQVAGILAAGNSSNPVFSSLLNMLYQGRLGLLHYANGSEAAELAVQSGLTRDEFISAAGIIAGSGMSSEARTVNGKEIVFLESSDGKTSLCAFSETGWQKIVMYKRFFPPVSVFNNSVGESTTCLDVIARRYDPSNARNLIGAAAALSAPAEGVREPILEAVVRSGVEKLYARAFSDENSAFLLMVSDAGAASPENCLGNVLNGSNTSVCHLASASLMGQVNLEAYERKQGQYTIIVFILPFHGTDQSSARITALAAARRVVFPGIPEYVWGTQPTQLSYCDFPSSFACASPSYSNGSLKASITSVRDSPVTVSGFKCTQESGTPAGDFALASPQAIQPNQTIELSAPCYVAGNETYQGDVVLLQSKLYLNITDPATNESSVIQGALFINNFGG
ncbi:MAG: CARDB domain-containing protein [Candidatus ainarchaeum sp.]|nr:CARDB domain-containing protein [Candidatus ainarchaeum sp.]